MSITIEGLPVLIEYQHQLRNFLADRLPPEEILFARWQSGAVLANPFVCDNAPDYVSSPYPPLPPLSVGEIQWPSGASRYARALYAVDWSTMKEVAKTAWGWEPDIVLIDPEGDPDDPGNQSEVPVTDVPDDWGTSFYEVALSITDGENTFSADMFALRPYRVTGNGADLWLLPLVDKRWAMGHLAFEPLDEAPEDSAALIDAIATAASAVITKETPSITGALDKRLWGAEQPAAALLDIACLSHGLRVVRDPGGTLRAVDAAFSDTRRGTRLSYPWKILSGGKRGPTELPKQLRVHCRKEGDVKFDVRVVNVTGGMVTGGPTLAGWTSWLSTPSNDTATLAFAQEIADSVAGWGDCGGQYCLAGALNYVPCGYDDYMSILVTEKTDAMEDYIFRTTVRELPGVFLPRAILVGGGDDGCCEPEDHFLFTLSEYMITGGANGEIRTMDDLTQVEASALVKNTLGHFSHLDVGDRGICIKVDGVYYAIEPTLSPGSTVGVTCTLTADLAGTVGATATATVDVSGDPGTTVGATVTVYNTTTKKAYSGAKGWAVKVNGAWWLVEVDQYALLSLATLSSDTHDISSGYTNNGAIARKQTTTISALVAISSYPSSFIPSSLPDLDNPRNLIALSGDKATVAYNRTNDKWEILEVRPATARLARIKITANWPYGTDASASSFTVIANESEVGGELPTISTVKDVNSLAMNARTNDIGIVRYNYVSEGWELVSISHRATMWRGVLSSSFSGTASTFSADCEAAYDGWPPSGTQTIVNVFGWETGTSGKKVIIAWNPIDEQWEPLQMGCP